MVSTKVKVGVTASVVVVVAAAAVLAPLCFSYVSYYEFGFKQRSSTGEVDTAAVIGEGRYFWGPDFKIKTYPASAQSLMLKLKVFTEDKLEIEITVFFQYFLRKEDLKYLHKNYDLVYHPTLKAKAVTSIKIETPRYSTEAFVNERRKIETNLFKVVREKLGGKCCAQDCNSWTFACPQDCIPKESCDPENDKGIWVDVKYFQLGAVEIPNEVQGRFLKSLILEEDAAREAYMQNASVIRKQTDQLVKQILNKAEEVRQRAAAEARLLEARSTANYTRVVELARVKGLKAMYDRLKIKTQEHKNSLDYLRTLRSSNTAHFSVDFQQRIVGTPPS